jgi:mRNA-degrading endonuclease RelE of RelBE toxin-antitoxin system
MRLAFSSPARKFITALHPPLKQRIENALLEIANDSRIGKSLKGDLEGYYSHRIGDWRIIYSIEKDFIFVKDIRHRRDVYRRR